MSATTPNIDSGAVDPGEISTIGHTTYDSIYRGPKGSFHKKHKNPRAERKTDWEQKFIELICNGDVDEYIALLNDYHLLNGNPTTKPRADGQLRVYIQKGAKEDMLRHVFSIGHTRYVNIRDGKEGKTRGGGGAMEMR